MNNSIKQDINVALTEYNSAYTNYLVCSNNKDISNCDILSNELTLKYNELNKNIKYLYSLLINDSNDMNVDNNFKKNNELRSFLELKLNEIYGNDSLLHDSVKEVEISMVSSLVWTILVSSLIYFVIVKL